MSGLLLLAQPTGLPRAGLVARYDFSRVNLLKYSEQFDNSVWSKGNTALTPNASVAPDGTMTADRFIADTTLTNHTAFESGIPVQPNVTYTASVYAKAAGWSYFRLALFDVAISTGPALNVNLTTGQIISDSTGQASALSVGNGWYRLSFPYTASANATTFNLTLRPVDNTGNSNITGDGINGYDLWGAQLNVGSTALPYERTTDNQTLLNRVSNYNLLAYSEQLDRSNWSKNNAPTVSADAAVAPDGTTTAESVTVSSSGMGVYQLVATPTQDTTYTMSIWIRGSVGGEVVKIGTDKPGISSPFTYVTLSTSWQRYSWSFTCPANNTSGLAAILYGGNATTQTFYAWGAQLNVGSTALPYEKTLASGATFSTNSGLSGYHGTLGSTSGVDSNDPQWQSSALLFDGVDDQVTLPLLAGASTWGGLTILSVVNSSVTATQEIIREGGVADGYFLRFNGDGVSVDFSVGNAGGQRDVYSNPAPRSGDQFLAMTWGLAGNLRGYTGATKVRDVASNLTSSGPTATTPTLGRIAGTEPFNGSMRYLAVYNRALSDREVRQAYRYLKGVMAGRGVTI